MAEKSTAVAQVKSGVFQNPFNNKKMSIDEVIKPENHKYAIALAAFVA